MTIEPCYILEEFFKEVKAGNIPVRCFGLCSNFRHFCVLRCYEIDCPEKLLKSMMRSFSKYTGHPKYPLVPREEYDTHSRNQFDFYDPTTSYGAIRLEFVEWALKEIAQKQVSYMKS